MINSGRCAACKNQRRKCPSDCIFSPYFPANDPQRFACVHRIYGCSNVGKMLQQIPSYVREEAANTLYYEAQCRIEDPVYGCVRIISNLHQQIHNAETELSRIQALLAIHQTPQLISSNFDDDNYNNNYNYCTDITFPSQTTTTTIMPNFHISTTPSSQNPCFN